MKRSGSRSKPSADPIGRFRRWIATAFRARIPLAEAMALATTDRRGNPSVRFVLLKHCDEEGFVFYTNRRSRKGRELRGNPSAALVFYWNALGRQVRIAGAVEEVSPAEADAYWVTRPRQSQLAAAVSDQSATLGSRAGLRAKYRALQERLGSREIPRPRHWTGYRLRPCEIEFWQHREHRLHERELFLRSRRGWTRRMLQP